MNNNKLIFMHLFETIVKNILTEATKIEKMYQAFSDYKPTHIKELAMLAPDTKIGMNPKTGEKNTTVNKIGIWLLNQAFRDEDETLTELFSEGRNAEIKDTLKTWKNCPQELREKLGIEDLSNVTFSELYETINDIDDDTMRKYGGKTKFDRAVARTKVYEDDDWIVCKVTNVNDDKIIGGGTTWCTASNGEYGGSASYYFDEYTNDGEDPLWVNINKHASFDKDSRGKYDDAKAMYQFAFEYNDGQGQYCDAHDQEVATRDFAENNPKLMDFYETVINEDYLDRFKDGRMSEEEFYESLQRNVLFTCGRYGEECYIGQDENYDSADGQIADENELEFMVHDAEGNELTGKDYILNCIQNRFGDGDVYAAWLFQGEEYMNKYTIVFRDGNGIDVDESAESFKEIDDDSLIYTDTGDELYLVDTYGRTDLGMCTSIDETNIIENDFGLATFIEWKEYDNEWSLYNITEGKQIINCEIPLNGEHFEPIEAEDGKVYFRCQGGFVVWEDGEEEDDENYEPTFSQGTFETFENVGIAVKESEQGYPYIFDLKTDKLLYRKPFYSVGKAPNSNYVRALYNSDSAIIFKPNGERIDCKYYQGDNLNIEALSAPAPKDIYIPACVETEDGVWNYLDVNGNFLLKQSYPNVNRNWVWNGNFLYNGLYNGKDYSYVNAQGQIFANTDSLRMFKGNLVAITNGDVEELINTKGQVLYTCKLGEYLNSDYDKNQWAVYKIENDRKIKLGAFTPEGKWVPEPSTAVAEEFKRNFNAIAEMYQRDHKRKNID